MKSVCIWWEVFQPALIRSTTQYFNDNPQQQNSILAPLCSYHCTTWAISQSLMYFFLTVYLENAIVLTFQMRNGSTGRWSNLLKIVRSSLQWRKKKSFPLSKIISYCCELGYLVLFFSYTTLIYSVQNLRVCITRETICPIHKKRKRETICRWVVWDTVYVVRLPRKNLYLFTGNRTKKKIFVFLSSCSLIPPVFLRLAYCRCCL